MSITNEGTFESGRFEDGIPWTIDRITLKISDGTRLTRYAVCVNGHWRSSDQMTLREARAEVKWRAEQHKPFKPVSVDDMREYAKLHGNRAAHDLLLLGGYGFIEGDCDTYDELLKEFATGGKANAV